MSTNISKQKREELLAKIKEIRTFIASAEQDENTGNLLSYLSELERDVGGKKYGLVFEEHREEIDEILATHTPVLTEDGSLLIDNGGQMNFLLEGDNLASLQLLLKTHKGKIDLIYIDPPYNTGHNDFAYDDNFVSANDAFLHSKWLSFMRNRLALAKNLLSTMEEHVFNVNESIALNSRSEQLNVMGPKTEVVMTEFPGTVDLKTPGVYTVTQMPISGKEVVENFYVRIPAGESNTAAVEDALTNPYFYEEEGIGDRDLVFYFALALIALLFIEWWLQLRKQF